MDIVFEDGLRPVLDKSSQIFSQDLDLRSDPGHGLGRAHRVRIGRTKRIKEQGKVFCKSVIFRFGHLAPISRREVAPGKIGA